MTDLRLDRTDRAPGGIRFAKNILQRSDFDSITNLGAGTVSFDQFDGLRINVTLFICSKQSFLLTGSARLVNRRTATVA